MIGVKVNGRFLDIKPGTSGEIQRKSPFFAINDTTEEYSTPLSFQYTENNCIALGFIFQYYTIRQKTRVTAECYDGNTFKYKCTLVIESGRVEINGVDNSEMSGYLLFGVSDFYRLIKGKKLSDLQLGGTRSFTWTTNLPYDHTDGFWQHMHATWRSDSTIPYVFAPIRNEAYYTEAGDVDWMNKLNDNGTLAYDFLSPLVPMIKLKYLLEEIFLEAGFTPDFSRINDAEWERLLLVNVTKVNWLTNAQTNIGVGPTPLSTIKIDLKKHVPQDKTISDFIVQLFGRYGWAPVFDVAQKKVRLVAGKEIGKGKRKDYTMYAEPVFTTNFNEDKKVFAFTNDIDSNDSLPSAPDFTNAVFMSPVFTAKHLPTPSPSIESRIIYCYLENQWYQVLLNETTNLYEWQLIADNIYNEEPAGATDTIATTISTLPVYFTLYRVQSGVNYYGFFPAMKHEYNKPIGYRTILWHGLIHETLENGTQGPKAYPYASSIRTTPEGLEPLPWSNVYRHKKDGGTINQKDYGIIDYWWKDFLNLLKAGEECIFKLWLPLHELINYAWDDELLIQNIPYVVKEMTEPIPYKGYVQATLKRITPAAAEVFVLGNTVVDGKIYARLITVPHDRYCDLIVNLYKDAAGTMPYTPPATLYVYVHVTATYQNGVVYHIVNYLPVNSASDTLDTSAFYEVDGAHWRYSLDPSGANDYVVI